MEDDVSEAKASALANVMWANDELIEAQKAVRRASSTFAAYCRDAYRVVNDREMAEVTTFSRARIQQFRKGSRRKAKNA